MNLVSVVTAVHGPSVPFLAEAYESLAAQVLPSGWDWEWLVQEDGTSGAPLSVLPSSPRVRFGTGRPLGQGVARTYALARASGSVVKVLDADDVLAPGILAREIALLASSADVGWTTCRVLDRLPDGSTVGFAGDPPDGRLPRGSVLASWLANDFRSPIHPATLCIRRDLLLNLGGWMALPAGEDTGLLMAASAVATGYFIASDGLYYRKWPGQVTADPAWTEPSEWAARNAVIRARAESLARCFDAAWPI